MTIEMRHKSAAVGVFGATPKRQDVVREIALRAGKNRGQPAGGARDRTAAAVAAGPRVAQTARHAVQLLNDLEPDVARAIHCSMQVPHALCSVRRDAAGVN